MDPVERSERSPGGDGGLLALATAFYTEEALALDKLSVESTFLSAKHAVWGPHAHKNAPLSPAAPMPCVWSNLARL